VIKVVSNNLRGGRIFRIAVGIAVLVLLLAGGVSAATLTVNASSGANYTKIQDAVNNASAGDTILVYSGIYYENVNVTKQLILRGIDNGRGKPVVDGSERSAIEIKASGVTLDGFNPRNSSLGIYVNSNNNTILNNNASNGAKIELINSNNNILSDNLANYNSYGIYLEDSNNNTLSGNTANFNSYGGIHLVYCNNNTLNGNSASINKEYGIYVGGSNNNTLIDNYAYSSYGFIT
jgi:nitrous oxidase accessory protein